MTDLRRRSFLTAATGVLAAGALASCSRGGSEGSAGPDDGASGTRVAWYGGQPVTEGLTAALDLFSQDNPDVPLTTESAPFDGYWDRMATQTAAGDPPAVMRMSMSYYAEYAERGALLDLAGPLSDGSIDASALDTDVAASGEIADGTYGVGQSSVSHAVFADADALAEHGFEMPADGWTWQDFEDLTTAYAEAAGDGSYGCNDNGGGLQAFEAFARQRSGDLFDESGALAVPADVIAEWFEMWDRLRSVGAAPPPDVTSEATGFEEALIATGRAPMQWGWVQQVTFYQPLVESSLQVAPVPAETRGDLSGLFVKALDLWCVSSRAADPDAAAQVVDFLLNDDRAIESVGITLGVPPSSRARDLLGADPESATGRAIDYIERISDQVGPPPGAWPNGYSALLSAFDRANANVAFGDADPTTAAQSVVDEAASALGG